MTTIKNISIGKNLQTALKLVGKMPSVATALDNTAIAEPVVYEQSRLIDKVKSTNEVNSLALLCGNA